MRLNCCVNSNLPAITKGSCYLSAKILSMQRYNRLLHFLAVIRRVLPFLLQDGYYQPHRNEDLYLAEAHHIAWGFMEVPPLLSVFAWITNLAGGGMFWIKFWPALFGSFTFLLVMK
jgi:hypothetical protein